MTKRHLKLMTEVLPSPTSAAATGPRTRTLHHMQRLLSATAFAVACSKQTPLEPPGFGVVDPMPPPARDRNEPDADAHDAPPSASTDSGAPGTGGSASERFATPPPSATPSQVVKPPKPPPDPGYGVVDPMPPPPERKHRNPR